MSVMPALNDMTPELLIPVPPGVADAAAEDAAAGDGAVGEIRECFGVFDGAAGELDGAGVCGADGVDDDVVAGFDADGAGGVVVESADEAAGAADVAGVVGHRAGDIGERDLEFEVCRRC